MGASTYFGEAVDRIGGQPISARMRRKAPVRHLDPMLVLVTLLLAAYGAVMVLSSTIQKLADAGLDENAFVKRQVAFIVAGIVALIVVSIFDYRFARTLAPFFYGATILGLILVLTPLGETIKGASRWINFGAFQMQPSELGKIAVIVAVAAYLAERKSEPHAGDIAVVIGLMLLPSVLIFLEPDLGSMMVYTALTGALLLVGGAKLRHFVALAVLGAIAILMAFQLELLKPYQLERLVSFVDPNPDVQSSGYNLTQSKIAIGSGGIRGTGLQTSACLHRTELERQGQPPDIACADTQTALDFVPEQHTDFIFTAVGEQLGFIGSATLLGLFALLIWRALRIAALSRDMFGALVAAGIAGLWAFQLFVNVGMTMGIMPITGIPLPFVSYGGSSLISNFVAVGLLLNIHMRRFVA
jgi:rod shape determining protein RodA